MRVAVTVEQSWHVVPGGIAVSTVELLRALSRRDDLELIGISARHERPPPPDLVPPIPVRQVPLPRRALYETWQWLRWPRIERSVGHVDVVHDAGYVVPPTRAPLVATIHDLLFLRYPHHYTWHSRLVLRRGLDLARRAADLVICPSRATLEACREAGLGADRLRLVPWGVHLASPDAERDRSTLQRYGVRPPFVLHVGTLEPRKNVGRVLDAFAALGRPELELVLVGPRGWKEERPTPTIPSSNGRVRWLGPVPREDLGSLYAGATIVVYATLAEGFGLPVLEAMAAGAPVVTSSGTATEEVGGDAVVLVDPLDVDAIASAIERILDDPRLAASLGQRARERAAGFTWERSAASVAEVYAEAAGRGR